MPNNSVRIAAVGDISPGDHYFSMGHGIGSTIKKSGVQLLLKELETCFNSSDIVIANLEGALSSYSCKSDDPVEGYVFRGHEDLAFGLKAAGVNVVNVANNHILQHGITAWNNTIKSLESAGIEIVGCKGTGEFISQPVLINVKEAKVAILGYSAIQEVYFPEYPVYAIADQASILNDVQHCLESANIVVVTIHAGIEGCTLPEYELVVRCREIADAGANIILVHHAHVFHPVENYRGSCVAYGLGNFLFDLLWDDSLVEAGIAIIDICTNGKIESIDIIPVKIQSDMSVRKMYGDQKNAFLERLKGVNELLEDKDKYQEYFLRKVNVDVARLEKKKLPYLLKHIYKGDTLKKIRFMVRKLINKFYRGLSTRGIW